jgi:small subunit ribosomal protein S17
MPKRILQGTVVSDKNEKTVVVKVERRFTHPVMKKTVRMTKKYKAHDENNAHKVGDEVFIQESKPISRTSAGSSCLRTKPDRRTKRIWKAGQGQTLPKNEEGDLS